MSELIKDYLREYNDEDTEEFPGGFITWKLFGVKGISALYVTRIYIHGPDRGASGVKRLLECINKVAGEQKVETLVASVCLRHLRAESLLLSFLRMGFAVLREKEVEKDQMLYLVKRLPV